GAPEASPLALDARLDPLRRLAAAGVERGRLDQFLLESAVLVPRAHAALRDGDLDAVAAATALSQQLAETHLRNQVPQTVELVRSAVELGACAASAFGAGFGGSVWALVPAAGAEGLAADWRGRYPRTSGAPESASTLVTRPGAPGRRVQPVSACGAPGGAGRAGSAAGRAPRWPGAPPAGRRQDLRVEDRSSTSHESPMRKSCSRLSGAAQVCRSAAPTAWKAGSTTSSRSACRCAAGAKPFSSPVRTVRSRSSSVQPKACAARSTPREGLVRLIRRLSLLSARAKPSRCSGPTGWSESSSATPVCRFELGHTSRQICSRSTRSAIGPSVGEAVVSTSEAA